MSDETNEHPIFDRLRELDERLAGLDKALEQVFIDGWKDVATNLEQWLSGGDPAGYANFLAYLRQVSREQVAIQDHLRQQRKWGILTLLIFLVGTGLNIFIAVSPDLIRAWKTGEPPPALTVRPDNENDRSIDAPTDGDIPSAAAAVALIVSASLAPDTTSSDGEIEDTGDAPMVTEDSPQEPFSLQRVLSLELMIDAEGERFDLMLMENTNVDGLEFVITDAFTREQAGIEVLDCRQQGDRVSLVVECGPDCEGLLDLPIHAVSHN